MRTLDRKTVGFWTFTGLFAGLMLLSAAMYLTGAPAIVEAMSRLGYPPYILTILGVAKLIGAVALLQNRLPTLREWAYAGFTINLVAAFASHVLAGDAASEALKPVIFMLPLAASYALRGRRPVARVETVASSHHPLAA
ncbi:MAG TPA: DoxX family protein [Vicinamibacterales bacterium]